MIESEFERYRKREIRRKKLEELDIAVRKLLTVMKTGDVGEQHIQLGKVYTILAALDTTPRTDAPA